MKTKKQNGSILLYFFLSLLLLLTGAVLQVIFQNWFNRDTRVSTVGRERRTVILDAGHGGFDGGAVSVTGTAEKVLNLDTTLSLAALLRAQGYRVILTRDSDIELTHEGGGSRKMQDLRGRLTITQENEGIPLLSIHMNKFPQSRYHGLQVYYSPNDPSSQGLAEEIQASVKVGLQPENGRAIKPATSSIFLLHKATSPAVLIECGFLSNEEEARRLEDPSYRASLTLLIASAYSKWEASR